MSSHEGPWRRLSPSARMCQVLLLAWTAFGGVQLTRLLLPLSAPPAAAELARQATWSPIYAFARACSPPMGGSEIRLVDPLTLPMVAGAAEVYGQERNVDAFNLAAFAYAMYPRRVRALEAAAPKGSLSAQSADLVAVWEQARDRSAPDRQAARATAAQLLADGYVLHCRFEDQRLGRGQLFMPPSAASGRAAAARAVEARPSPALSSYLSTLLGLIALWGVGACLARMLAPQAPLPLVWTSALPLGCVAVSAELLVLSQQGWSWSLAGVLSPWVCLVLATAVYEWRRSRPRREAAKPPVSGQPHAREEMLAWLLLLTLVASVAFAAPRQLPFSDGFMFYYFKARAFFHDRSVTPFYHHADAWLFTMPAHPPLVSLVISWLYLFVGHVEEGTTQLWWAALLASCLASYYQAVRSWLSRAPALWSTLALGVAGNIAGDALMAGFADLPLAVFAVSGAGLAVVGLGNKSVRLLALSGACFGAGVFTKQEGLPLVLITAAACGVWSYTEARGSRSLAPALISPMVVLGSCLASSAPWWIVRSTLHVPELLFDLHTGAAGLVREVAVAAVGFSARAAVYWLPIAAIALSTWLALRSRGELSTLREQRALMLLLAIVLAQAAVDVLGIAVSPVEVHAQVRVAARRLLIHLIPLAAWAASILWALLTRTARPVRLAADGRD